MPILNKAQVKRKVTASTSLHKGNEDGELTPDESGQSVENNMSVDTLIDPEDYEAGGNTHFSNDETSHPVLAGKKDQKPGLAKVNAAKRIKANENADDEEGGTTLNPGTTNVGTIDNEVDPDQGYIGANLDDVNLEGDVDDEDFENNEFTPAAPPADDPDATFDAGDENSGTDVEASDTDLQNNMSVNPIEASDEGDEDWDAPPPDDDVEEMAEEDEESGDGGVAIEDVEASPEDAPGGAEDLSILDIDETPDDAVEDVAFATFGTRLMAIKANRIIATMTSKMAVAAGRNDVYLSDQFQQVTAMQLEQKGLRKGLKSMGFALAKVSLAKQSNIQAMVKKEVTKTTAAVRAVNADKEKAFEQSLAIASVGINRQMFKGSNNALHMALASEFRRLGIRGANRILDKVFAAEGPAYAKQIVELAKKIAAAPEEVRDGYVDALDMTNDSMDTPDEDMIPVGANDDMDEDGGDFEDGFGQTLEASLARPGHAVKASVAASGKYSVTANEILNGSRPLF